MWIIKVSWQYLSPSYCKWNNEHNWHMTLLDSATRFHSLEKAEKVVKTIKGHKWYNYPDIIAIINAEHYDLLGENRIE